MQTLLEYFSFLRHRRKYWLWPLIVMLLLVGIFVILAQTTVLGPLLYSLF